MELEATNEYYAHAVHIGAQQRSMLREATEEAGFSAEELKSTHFSADSEY